MVEDVFSKVDIDKSGFVDFTEFVSAAAQEEKLLNKLKLEQTFKIFDIVFIMFNREWRWIN